MSFFSWKRRTNNQAPNSSSSPPQINGQAPTQIKDTAENRVHAQRQQHTEINLNLQSSPRPTNGPLNKPAYPWSTCHLQLLPPVILPKPGALPPTKPSPSPFPRYGYSLPAATTQKGELLLFGGLLKGHVQNDLYSFNPSELSSTHLQTTGEVPSPRFGHASALVSSVLIVWGGDTRSENNLDRRLDDGLYLLNLVTREWTRVAINSGSSPSGRYGHAVALVGTCFYVFGGHDDDGFRNDLWAFDLNTLRNKASWELVKASNNEVPVKRAGHSCMAYKERLIIFGGTDSQYHYNDTWEFNTTTRKWTELDCIGFIPSPREGHAAALVDDVIYIFGGRGIKSGDLAAFKISNQRWYMFQNMGSGPDMHGWHRMSAVGTRIYVLGGESHLASDGGDSTMIHVLETKRIKYPGASNPPPRIAQESATPPQSSTSASPTVSSKTSVESVDEMSDELVHISFTANSSINPLRDILTKLTHLDLTGKVKYDSSTIRAHGGYCDVFVGEYYASSSSNIKIAVKRLRIHAQGSHDFAKQLAKEMNVWSKLVHPNILHLWGYVLEGEYPCLVSQWMENGTVLRYLTMNPKIDAVRLILGIASGLEYLHELDIIHSDIKADNVLVSQDGRPLICDFGISRRISNTHTILGGTTTGAIKGSIRWMSPEILDLSNAELVPGHTKEADVWAFGMLVYEVLTQKLPFYHLKLDVHVMLAIMNGQIPLSDDFRLLTPRLRTIWSLCCDKLTCWNKDPVQRPTMRVVLSDLERCSSLTQGLDESELGLNSVE